MYFESYLWAQLKEPCAHVSVPPIWTRTEVSSQADCYNHHSSCLIQQLIVVQLFPENLKTRVKTPCSSSSSLFPLPVLNDSSQEEVSVRDIRILPNLNASYLPVMPDGSVLLVDNVWCVTSPCVGVVKLRPDVQSGDRHVTCVRIDPTLSSSTSSCVRLT